MKKKPDYWITRGGKHIPIYLDPDKEEQIKKNVEQAKVAKNGILLTVSLDPSPVPINISKQYESFKSYKNMEPNRKRQIAANKADANKIEASIYVRDPQDSNKLTKIEVPDTTIKNASSYSEYGSNVIKAMAVFEKNTGIKIEGHVFTTRNHLYETMDKLQELHDLYGVGTGKAPLTLRIHSSLNNFINSANNINENVMAYSDIFQNKAEIVLSPRYYKQLTVNELKSIYDTSTKPDPNDPDSPWHPSGSTYRDNITHEVGHQLFDQWIYEQCRKDPARYRSIHKMLEKNSVNEWNITEEPVLQDLVNKFFSCKEQMLDITGWSGNKTLFEIAHPKTGGKYSLCGYAAENFHELVAECFVDFHANGKNCKQLSAIVVKELLGFEH